jgi:hypothetical protein
VPGKAADVRVGLLAVGVVLLAYGCDDRGRTERPFVPGGMKVTRNDGSRVRFADRAVAYCLDHGDRKRTTRYFYVQADDGPRGSYWIVRRRTDAIERSPAITFPDNENGVLLVFDPVTGYKLRSNDPLASGRLVIEEWGCDHDDSARISVHGTLASDGRRKSVSRVDGDVVPVFLSEPEDD